MSALPPAGVSSPKTETVRSESPSLRIGIVTHYMTPHIGGIEIIADVLSRSYTRAGCEVCWVASRIPKTTPSREAGRLRVRCWNGLEERLGVPWPLWGPGAVKEIACLAQWADVLHVHDCLYLGSALAVLFARRLDKPVLLSQHIGYTLYTSAVLTGLQRVAYKTLGRTVLAHASHVNLCTPAAEQFVTQLLGDRTPPNTSIPYGIDTERFRPPTAAERTAARQRLGLPESAEIVLFVGRLIERKGVDIFFEVSRRMPGSHFLMVGDGPLRPDPATNLTWLPFVAPDEMEIVYRAADLFVLPSHSEGFPLAVHEAMATGIPVIVPQGEAFAARLERAEGVCISTERTPEAIRLAVDRLRQTPGLSVHVGARARALVVREWSLESMGRRYLECIRSLADGSTRSAAALD